MPTAGSDWQNFLNMLNSSQGTVFYVSLLIMASMYPALIGFLRLTRAHQLNRFPATALWSVLGFFPFLYLAGLGYRGGLLPFVAILGSTSAIPLFAGVIIIHWRHKTGRLPGILVWLGLGLVPVFLFLLILSSMPTVAGTFAVISAIPLVLGLVGAAFANWSVR